MFERLKIGFMRWMAVKLVAFNWRRGRATNLVVTDDRIDVENGRIGVRIYTPQGPGPFPVMLYLHGGGWVGCNLDTHDALCRDLCTQAGHLVVSVDYRLAPEYPFPTGVMDCLTALDWVVQRAGSLNGDIGRLVIAGDSAGGNLAAVLSNEARQRHPALIKAQVLIYPVTDHPDSNWPSYTTHGGKGFKLTRDGMIWMWSLYLRGNTLPQGPFRHELATPLHVEDLRGLPPTLVLLAELDALRDEGRAYARRLAEAGVDVKELMFDGQQHGFVGLEPTPAHREAVTDIVSWLDSKRLTA